MGMFYSHLLSAASPVLMTPDSLIVKKDFTPDTAVVDPIANNDKILPYFDMEDMKVVRVLTDRGTEYGWNNLEHPYQLFLHLNSIEHTRPKTRHPQTNGAVERLNQIIQDEFYRVAFRKKLYKSLEEIQSDLDVYMSHYNTQRTNQGKRCQGRTPEQTFTDGYGLYKQYMIENKKEVTMEN